jgi:diaminohydroxyphosphoribosylaminopyrimidine deaminase/5-amino-6-(5-phosphoribosylamino)uracil reductase
MKNLRDISYLEMAYSLAQKAKGWTSPNPYVGAVIVKNRAIIGSGYHKGPGQPHAEIVALQKAGPLHHNSTIYLTLEPCIHWGRTPPCIESLLKSHPKRVVISAPDQNPLVHNKGIQALRESGIDVSVGLLQEKNDVLNEAYIKYITKKIPFVSLKAAISLDGKMATKSFSSQWISNSQTREYTQLLRGEHDAILIGAQTLIKDNPRLTLRHPDWKGKKQLRIILDPELKIPINSRILNTTSRGKIIIFTKKPAESRKAAMLKKANVDVIFLPGSSSSISLKRVLVWLGQHEISSVLVEGGGRLHTSFLDQRLADKVFISLSPKLIGGEKSPSLFQGTGVKFVKDALQLRKIRTYQIENDIILEGYF